MKRISRQNIFKGKIIKVFCDQVELSDGTKTERELVSHREAVAVVAVNDKQELLMVTQYRYPIGRDMLELPAGLIDEGEAPLETAKRELKEETGYEAKKWELLTTTYSSPGSHDEKIYIYLAEELTHVSELSLDEDERLTLSIESFGDIMKGIKTGEIQDGKTIIGVLLYSSLRNENS
jgi:ADP-ribose pyrophosphatase